jgi:DnaJ-class molecular chaperone
LDLSTSEREAKVKFRALCRIYHPDKHDPSKIGLTDLQAKEKSKPSTTPTNMLETREL